MCRFFSLRLPRQVSCKIKRARSGLYVGCDRLHQLHRQLRQYRRHPDGDRWPQRRQHRPDRRICPGGLPSRRRPDQPRPDPALTARAAPGRRRLIGQAGHENKAAGQCPTAFSRHAVPVNAGIHYPCYDCEAGRPPHCSTGIRSVWMPRARGRRPSCLDRRNSPSAIALILLRFSVGPR